jgi:excinuclease UvrABC nuclease subunit
MTEVVYRLQRLLDENQPLQLIIDGGKGQLSALKVLMI